LHCVGGQKHPSREGRASTRSIGDFPLDVVGLLVEMAGLLVVVVGLLLPGSVSAESSADPVQRAARLEQAGAYGRAADALRPLCARFDQDYALLLRTAALFARGGRPAAAELFYRRALALSGGSRESRIGLAWALAAQKEREAAHAQFKALELRHPDDPVVVRGLIATAAPEPLWVPSVGALYHFYANHPFKRWALGMETTLAVRPWRAVGVFAAYRYLHFFAPTSPAGAALDGAADFDQHGLFLGASYGGTRLSASVRGAYLNDGSGLFPHTFVAGLAGAVAFIGEFATATTVSFYDDLTVTQASLGWRSPALGPFTLRPEVALQHADGDLFVAGRLEGGFAWRWLTIWAGGTLGRQFRPTDLKHNIVYAIPEHLLFGLAGGLQVRPSRGLQLVAFYAIDQLELPGASGARRRTVAQYAGLRLALRMRAL
jgi:tetratricopeptide (TPR) repeat protein